MNIPPQLDFSNFPDYHLQLHFSTLGYALSLFLTHILITQKVEVFMKSCIIKIVMLLTFIIALPLTSNASEKN